MATKLKPDAITADDIKSYLATQDDFALEIRVKRAAEQLRFSVEHGGTYRDPHTDKPRQFDLRVQTGDVGRQVILAIECKCLQPNFPLLISRIGRTAEEGYHQLIQMQSLGLPPGPVRPGLRREMYRSREPVGKAATQVGIHAREGTWVDGDGDTYEKWSQALQSAAVIAQQAMRGEKGPRITAIIPVLVVSNGTLWVVDYDVDGNTPAAPVNMDEATLYVDHKVDISVPHDAAMTFSLTHLSIFTEGGIAAFMHDLANRGIRFDALFD
jgi:hypothetical protein